MFLPPTATAADWRLRAQARPPGFLFDWMRQQWPGTRVLKGLLDEGDAHGALSAGNTNCNWP